MTQLTQGSDMELRKIMLVIKADIQADPELYKSWKPFDDYESALKQLIQRSIDRANVIAMLLAKWNAYEELLLNESIKPTRRKEIEAKAAEYRKAYQDRIAELVQQLSPTTTEDKDNA